MRGDLARYAHFERRASQDCSRLLAQSGAFILCRRSRNPRLRLRLGVSLGNQLDAALPDFLKALADDPECRAVAAYVEGFGPGLLAATVQAAVKLRARDVPLVVTEQEDWIAPVVKTAPWGYLRLHRSGYTDESLTRWTQVIGDQGWTEAFVFFKHEEEIAGPPIGLRFQELANEEEH